MDFDVTVCILFQQLHKINVLQIISNLLPSRKIIIFITVPKALSELFQWLLNASNGGGETSNSYMFSSPYNTFLNTSSGYPTTPVPNTLPRLLGIQRKGISVCFFCVRGYKYKQ